MKILGVSDSHDSGAAVIEDGAILAAVNEERLIRSKLCWGFPSNSIIKVLELAKLAPGDIDLIAVASKNLPITEKAHPYQEGILFEESNRMLASKLGRRMGWFFETQHWVRAHRLLGTPKYLSRKKALGAIFRKMGFNCPVKYFEHHQCHAASAYFTGGKKTALVITSDAAGDALSATVSRGEDGHLMRLKEVGSFNSLAKYYSYVTVICGFKEGRHEGKITGLAAHGKPVYLENLGQMIEFRNGGFSNKSHLRHEAAKKRILEFDASAKKEDLAASVQQFTEEEMKKFAKYWIGRTGIEDLVLAGGIFANVRINQELLENTGAKSVFIHPHMGDGGLALGAALYAYSLEKKLEPFAIDDVYFGNEPGEIKEGSRDSEIIEKKYRRVETNSPETEVAALLKKELVVGLCNGRMEYGPRALGNRTILANPSKNEINADLNKRLKRTEFMPFAPVFEPEMAPPHLINYVRGQYPAKFMTITFYTEGLENAPAIVHIDNTARPQVIEKKANPAYFGMVRAFREETGIPCAVNTSFNVHEEPIVCTAHDALMSFEQGCIDALVLNGELFVKK
ncbi:MAG: hypothetical protein NT067_05690 [Candidatus Diapherotrites archaeon]|nr:hypothetical protein [Candidatus Diapherotrites archaeon]